jgi:hypothetical protein
MKCRHGFLLLSRDRPAADGIGIPGRHENRNRQWVNIANSAGVVALSLDIAARLSHIGAS